MSNQPKVDAPSYKEKLGTLLEQLSEMLPAEALETFNRDADQLAKNHKSPIKLSPGDKAPSFSLPNAIDNSISLKEVLAEGPVVLTFYRGTWCPYCNLALKTYQQILPQIKQAGASLVAISPQTPDNSLNMKEKNNLEFEVLSDVGNEVARQYTTVFKNGIEPIEAMNEMDIDFYSFYSDDSGEIPVPATFVINQDGTIGFARSEGGDYRKRVEPEAILKALES
ncbi:MAG: AhpC/TSA family protein [Balneolaceae bacterium]|nr:AhpC/TSA family protein [Balneolaceae bacterium]